MSDLVSGLLAKLDDEEAAANRMCHSNPDDGGYYSCPAVHTEQYGDLPWGEDACECRLKQRRESILRLCRAHRDLIGLHREGGMVQVGHDADTASRFAYCTTCGPVGWPCDTLRAVARGLGVEEQSSE